MDESSYTITVLEAQIDEPEPEGQPAPEPFQMISPAPGATLSGASQEFVFNDPDTSKTWRYDFWWFSRENWKDGGPSVLASPGTASFIPTDGRDDVFIHVFRWEDGTNLEIVNGRPADKYRVFEGRYTADASNTSNLNQWIELFENDWELGNVDDNAVYRSNQSGRSGFQSDSGATDAWQVSISQGENRGAARIWEKFSGNEKEVEMRYRVFVPENIASFWKDSDQNMKMPGLAGDVSVENGGFGGSPLAIFEKRFRAWSARQQMRKPGDPSVAFSYGMEMYYPLSPTDNGQSNWYSENGTITPSLKIVPGRWAEIRVHVRLNDFRTSNGFIKTYIDGEQGYVQENVEWSEAEARLVFGRIWFNVYHGGASKNSAGTLNLFFRKFEYKINELKG